MAKVILFGLLSVLACVSAQRITTIHLDGVQYFISRMNPYSPELNYFLAYQYCRSLGLQLASFETKEKSESMTTYLKNAGYGNYDFWTSGNRLGTGMFLWMSTGLPFNATFDFFENSGDALQTSLLDANDHNSNTAPQRTARDSSSGSEKGCVILKQPSLKWMPEDCSAVKDFICEQTRCYYYNYGSIPVSSAQGRPITSTTPQPKQKPTVTEIILKNTTPLPVLMSTYAYNNNNNNNNNLLQHQAKKAVDLEEEDSQPSFMSLNLGHEEHKQVKSNPEQGLEGGEEEEEEQEALEEDEHDENVAEESDETAAHVGQQQQQQQQQIKEHARELKKSNEQQQQVSLEDKSAAVLESDELQQQQEQQAQQPQQQLAADAQEEGEEAENSSAEIEATEENAKSSTIDNYNKSHEVDEHVKQISHKIEKIVSNEQMYPLQHHPHGHFHHQDNNNNNNNNNDDDDDSNRQSFLSLTDLIRTLRPNDKQIPQIDSDYSNAMRVLGENTGPFIKNDDHQPRGNNNFRDSLEFSTH